MAKTKKPFRFVTGTPQEGYLNIAEFLYSSTRHLEEILGYTVTSISVTLQSGKEFIRFKLDPAPPGRGRQRWERDEEGRHRMVAGGFRSAEFAGTTPRLNREGMMKYIVGLPRVGEAAKGE